MKYQQQKKIDTYEKYWKNKLQALTIIYEQKDIQRLNLHCCVCHEKGNG